MKHRNIFRDSKGFTLVEIILVLIILGVLGSIAVSRYIDLETNSKWRAIDGGIADLNGVENITWANQKVSSTGYIDDENLRAAINYNLSGDYIWDHGPHKDHGTLNFMGESAPLLRTESTTFRPGVWSHGTFH